MAYSQKMSETEIYRWGAYKLDILPRQERKTDFERLDLKWRLEKIELISAALENPKQTDPDGVERYGTASDAVSNCSV